MLNRRGVPSLQPVSLTALSNGGGSNPPSPARSGQVSQAQASGTPIVSTSPMRHTPMSRYKNSSDNMAAVLGSSTTLASSPWAGGGDPSRVTRLNGGRGQSTPPTPVRSSLGALPGISPGAGTPTNGVRRELSLASAVQNSSGSIQPAGIPSTPTQNSPLQYEFKVLSSSGRASQAPVQLSVGSGALQGFRPSMEDEHFSHVNVTNVESQPVSVFGILDGHCGRRVAELGCRIVPECFLSHPAIGQNNALALAESIVQADRSIFQAMGKTDGGSTLIMAVVHGRMLFVACLGDARAVVYDGNSTIAMSEDHKPGDIREQQRIVRCGGTVQFGRVCGCLAVSRALGDYEFKFSGTRFTNQRELMVSNLADVKQINITDATKFLVMGCDGVWDVLTNEESTQFVVDYLRRVGVDKLRSGEVSKILDDCATKLADYAIERGSMDNVSVTLVFFHDVAQTIANEPAPAGSALSFSSSASNQHFAFQGHPHTPSYNRGPLPSPYTGSPAKGRTPLVGRR